MLEDQIKDQRKLVVLCSSLQFLPTDSDAPSYPKDAAHHLQGALQVSFHAALTFTPVNLDKGGYSGQPLTASPLGETCSVVPTLERHTYKILSRSKGTTVQDIEAGCISVCYIKQGRRPRTRAISGHSGRHKNAGWS